MPTCAACGADNPDVARFCMSCATPLGARAQAREERKVVTVLFADLVGFTSRSERLDVEEVRRTLEPYHALLRRELERVGGTVEKFIGDAVMAVFGAPVAREDDAERAVRAGLAIRDAVDELGRDLHVRVGIATGEALVAVDARAELGETLVSGDVVNTAARLQTAAPVDGVLVSDQTFRATERTICYDPHEPVLAKGKSEPVLCKVASEPRSLVPTAIRETTPLVGRARERRLLVDALERCRAERSVQLVTVVGVPGIGKSRLVAELRTHVEDAPEITRWRQGRVLPYGDGVAFWPLSEIVKQQAGILESDGTATATAKLDSAIDAVGLGGVDALWVRRHLAPLVGVGASGETGGREEAFAGWRLFVEAMAADRASVLVVEDLHWADDALLDFLDGLVERIGAVPLLVVCTSRPELWERRPGWGGGKPNAATVSLQPLSDVETQELISALIDPTLLDMDAERDLLARAEGNPLYAQEYVRMLVERGADARELPASVQGIIAARLDSLSAEEKSLLQDAAVIGRTVWLGAVCALGGRDPAAAMDLVFRLERKQLLRRARRSSVAGETELSFAHSLIEEVAYAQLTRPQRAERHERAADWVERLSAGREDRAELVAHHLSTALELRTALGQDTAGLRARTLEALAAATRQAAMRHEHAATVAFSTRALGLDPDAALRAELLVRRAVAHATAGTAAEDMLLEAREAAVAAGLLEDAVHVGYLLIEWAEGHSGSIATVDRYGDEALAIAAELPPGPVSSVPVYFRGYRLAVQGRSAEALAVAEAEIARAGAVHEEQAAALMLVWRGAARAGLGDPDGGVEDMRDAYRILDAHAHPKAAVSAGNLAELLFSLGRLEESRTAFTDGALWARRIGHQHVERLCVIELAALAWHAGRADEAARILDAEVPALRGDDFTDAYAHLARGHLDVAEHPDRAVDHANGALAFGDATDNTEVRLHARALLATAERARGRDQASRDACDGFLREWVDAGGIHTVALALLNVGIVLAAHGRHADLARAADVLSIQTPWTEAVRALVEADYDAAAAILDEAHSIPLRDAVRELSHSASARPAVSDTHP